MLPSSVPAPVLRSRARRAVGREYFVLRRRLADIRARTAWADATGEPSGDQLHTVVDHASVIRRSLPGVDPELQENKHRNLELAIAQLDGVTLQPGETFSFWRHVGRPTRQRGFLDGLVLDQGRVSSGVGGGLCQLSNLLFWMVAHTPLTITERHRHLFDVFPDAGRSVPFGAGATVAFNYVDLRVRNNTSSMYRLGLAVDDTHLRGEILSDAADPYTYGVVERDHRFDQQPWGGYSRHNVIVRQVRRDSTVVREDVLAVNDALVMYSPMLDASSGPSASEQDEPLR